MKSRTAFVIAGIMGASGVGLGAFGAHGLRAALLESGMASAWETAARYQLLHAVVLVGAAIWLNLGRPIAQKRLSVAASCWTLGIVLFSGSLYGLALGGPRWLGPITPIGGVLLLVGWLAVIWTGMATDA